MQRAPSEPIFSKNADHMMSDSDNLFQPSKGDMNKNNMDAKQPPFPGGYPVPASVHKFILYYMYVTYYWNNPQSNPLDGRSGVEKQVESGPQGTPEQTESNSSNSFHSVG